MKLAVALVFLLTLAPTQSVAQPSFGVRFDVLLSGRGATYSSPVVAEIDGNPGNGREIAVVGGDGIVYVYSADGSLLWERRLPNFDCTATSARDKAYSSPAVGALFGDGVPYVVTGYGGFRGGRSCDGGVIAYRGSSGEPVWNFSIRTFAARRRFFAFSNTVFSSPALADVDGDGRLEVGFGGFDRNVYLLEHDGRVRWFYHAADTVWSSPVFANIDRDPGLEMLIGTDISANRRLRPPTRNGGFLYAFRTNSLGGRRIPFRDPERRVTEWRRFFPQVIYSSPAVRDLVTNRSGAEVVIGTGCFFPEGSPAKTGNAFSVLAARGGRLLQQLPIPLCSASSAAIGDINGDGRREVVVSVDSNAAGGSSGGGTLHAFSNDGNEIWRSSLREVAPLQSPLIVDLDRNGIPEIVMTESLSVAIFDGRNGSVVRRIRLPGTSQSNAAINDLDGDGNLDLVVASGKSGRGRLSAFGFQSGPFPLSSALTWPTWRG